MAITNHERVGKALDLLKGGLAPYVQREIENTYPGEGYERSLRFMDGDRMLDGQPVTEWDSAALLKLMWNAWNSVFWNTLGHAERSIVSELRDHRNRWAHQQSFSSDDADRALDSIARLLAAVSAPEADEVGKMKMELRRLIFDELMRSEQRRSTGTAIETDVTGTLAPWREIVSPHRDVASGVYQQAEFAADLWQVHIGEGSDEYSDPSEFFRRTYLTESLAQLLVGAAQRLSGQGGDPVVQLQTNFGGGKTHSMLALYHLFSATASTELAGVDAVLGEAGIVDVASAKRVVLVGNKISPGNPVTKADGTVVRTLWGELAWQLGGKEAFDRIRADDENATSPGDALRELMNDYGPCLILIDEWVAYARQLHEVADLPAGSFETHFSFAQVLTESAKAADRCLLVISLPASDTPGTTQVSANDVEVGGARGREALDRLGNAVGRVESSWRPANAEESFEIVRRRLFEPLVEESQFVARDTVARAFFDLYRTQHQEFPPECREAEYEKRLKAAYPIHPEVFDRLYTDWSALLKFQRTRGVLRLMAAVIHSLWEKGDRNPLILPSNISIDDPRVQFELTRYLPDNWVPVIEKDVDGPNALPLAIDGEVTNLGKFHATRRVARTIYLGSAPTGAASNIGLEDRRIKLGCVMPGESPTIFGDALRRLSSDATYLYHDGSRYWYSTQPTVTKLAEDRAEQLKLDPDKASQELDQRLRADLRATGDFARVHPLPQSGQDVPDDMDARLVVLSPEYSHSREAGSTAESAANAILESHGSAPRIFRNTLVFLAADQTRLQDLDEAARRYLAWRSILDEKEILELAPNQVRQAETQLASMDGAVTARLPEAYQWLLVPEQSSPQSEMQWEALRLTGQGPLAERASKKLRSDELLVTSFAGTRLRMELDRIPLWRGDHVELRQLIEDFARYLYLPRLSAPSVVAGAVSDGLGLLLWLQESFAYADSFDEGTGRYTGLRGGGELFPITSDSGGLVVNPEVAQKQLTADTATVDGGIAGGESAVPTEPGTGTQAPEQPGEGAGGLPSSIGAKRFHGSVKLESARVGRDAGRIADEVIAHIAGLIGADVTVTLEIEATMPDGAPENVVRTVTENSQTLKFTSHGFEAE